MHQAALRSFVCQVDRRPYVLRRPLFSNDLFHLLLKVIQQRTWMLPRVQAGSDEYVTPPVIPVKFLRERTLGLMLPKSTAPQPAAISVVVEKGEPKPLLQCPTYSRVMVRHYQRLPPLCKRAIPLALDDLLCSDALVVAKVAVRYRIAHLAPSRWYTVLIQSGRYAALFDVLPFYLPELVRMVIDVGQDF